MSLSLLFTFGYALHSRLAALQGTFGSCVADTFPLIASSSPLRSLPPVPCRASVPSADAHLPTGTRRAACPAKSRNLQTGGLRH